MKENGPGGGGFPRDGSQDDGLARKTCLTRHLHHDSNFLHGSVGTIRQKVESSGHRDWQRGPETGAVTEIVVQIDVEVEEAQVVAEAERIQVQENQVEEAQNEDGFVIQGEVDLDFQSEE